MISSRTSLIVAGIDVGGTQKGFYAVGFNQQTIKKFSSADAKAIVA